MFFDTEHEGIQILDVLELRHSDSHSVGNRNFHALSYRIEADTDISYDGKTIKATTGALAYFPPKRPYRRVSRFEHTVVVHFLMPDCSYTDIELIYPKNQEEIKLLFEKMLAASSLKNGKKYRLCELLCRILSSVLPKHDLKASPISRVKEYIDDNFTDKLLSVSDIAARAYMSEVNLRKQFKKRYGTSPKEYILNLRFNYAISLMKSDEIPISSISSLCGFTDEKHFSTLFKKRFGVPPSVYKKSHFS